MDPWHKGWLPDFMYRLFDNRLFGFLMFSWIAFAGVHDFKVAFVIGLLYALMMHNFSQKKITEAFLSGLRNEGFHDRSDEGYYQRPDEDHYRSDRDHHQGHQGHQRSDRGH